VAYNPNASEYLATWRDQTDDNLQGRRISANGAFLGGPFVISPVFPGSNRAASVAFDPGNDRYLAVFREFAEANLLGQFVTASGGRLGSTFTIASGLEEPARPYIAYSPIDRVFVIVSREGSDVAARLLSEHGTVLGPPLVIASGTATTEPAIAYNSRTGEFLVVWPDDRNESLGEMDMYAQVLDIVRVGAGDANCDGSVNAIDAALALQASAGLIGWAPCLAAADANGDGFLDAIDAALILQYTAGLIPTLPP
jgi:hypothetical protein